MKTPNFGESGRSTTKFGEGEEREKNISEIVSKIFGNHPGYAHPRGEATTKNWVRRHGDVSLEQILRRWEFAAYVLTTRTLIVPGDEARCEETRRFITQTASNPLWRIEEDEDLKRFSPKQARSVIEPYLLTQCDNAYDVTSLEAACQFYLENEIGMPHGMCLHKQAGAGSRLQNSVTPSELELMLKGEKYIYSLAISMIEVTDCKFADTDPENEERSPPLLSASVPINDGTDTVYCIQVRGHKQSFQNTPSVLADKESNEASNAAKKERHKKRKLEANEPTGEAVPPQGLKKTKLDLND